MRIVRVAARELSGADGVTFVLRDGDLCHYADEDAIGPLWKGQRFPMSSCISGWVMLHRHGVVIEDVCADPRIPVDAYRPTFVRSMAMVPIRTHAPVGALGSYWASHHRAAPEEMDILGALADCASVAMESFALRRRYEALIELQRQKEALSADVLHDLKSPLSAIMLAASLRLRSDEISALDRRCWSSVLSSAEHVHRTALNLLDISDSRDGKLVPRYADVDVEVLLSEVRDFLLPLAQRREHTIVIGVDPPGAALRADAELLRRVLQNLVDNGLRYSPPRAPLCVEARAVTGAMEFTVSDEGPGVPAALRDHVFVRHTQLGGAAGAAETCRGLGLAFCRLAVEAHGGVMWIDDNEPRGSRFCFRLPNAAR